MFRKRFRRTRTGGATRKKCLMIGGSGMAGVWIKHFTESFSDRVRIVGLCDVDRAVLEERGRALDLAEDRLFTDFEAACAGVEADFCAVAIPQAYHAPAAVAAMENGMPVLCEKPIADSLESAKAMLAVSRSTGLLCSITQQFRYAPNKQELVRLRDGGRLGRLQHVVGRYADDYRKFTSTERPHRELLFDGCVHHFDMLRFLSGGDCETLVGMSWNPEWSSFDRDSAAIYLMRMTNGVHASLEANGCAAGLTTDWHSDYRAEFEAGTVELSGADRVTVHRAGRRSKTYKAPSLEWFGHAYLFNEFLDWLDGGPPAATRVEDNIRSFAMAVAARDAVGEASPRRIADYLGDADREPAAAGRRDESGKQRTPQWHS